MRSREKILNSLENVYRGAFTAADESGDNDAMARLDMEYQRDQVQLEVLLDIRDLLTPEEPDTVEKTTSLLEKAKKIRTLTRLR